MFASFGCADAGDVDLKQSTSLFSALLLAGCGSIHGCNALDLPDQIKAEAVAPAGDLVARAWCLNGCDIFYHRALTISRTDAAPGEFMPADEFVIEFNLSPTEAADMALRWRTANQLEIVGKCLVDNEGQPLTNRTYSDVSVRFVRLPPNERCPEPKA